ncbi:response regulator transcription factor [Runella sp. MFBS21]|uniref:response regulator n=1 Tax=Runella sp. MFBS21 TaxID=3034018 RepID=UPI0023F8F9D7|nr:response regulator transcription factor [Runella sp. MFBS21]MDF7818306.1 response regulator transcription factor [Runella sp. MFBS21]
MLLLIKPDYHGFMSNTSIHILLVDDYPQSLEELKEKTASIKGVKIVDSLIDSRKVIPLLAHTSKLDIILLDVHMPYLTGVDVAYQVRALYPSTKILFLTTTEDETNIHEALKAGVQGHILKSAPQEEFEKALSALKQNKSYFNGESV